MSCAHIGAVKTDRPRGDGCEECLKMGDAWVHLRLCRTWSWCYVDEVEVELA